MLFSVLFVVTVFCSTSISNSVNTFIAERKAYIEANQTEIKSLIKQISKLQEDLRSINCSEKVKNEFPYLPQSAIKEEQNWHKLKTQKRLLKEKLMDLMNTPEIVKVRKTHLNNVLGAKHDKLKILSIDGGGIKGLMVIYALHLIEKSTGKQVYELFDFVIGVSTGGLITSLFTIPTLNNKILTAKEILELYIDKCREIFAPAKKSRIFSTKYLTFGLKNLVSEYIGSFATIADAVIPIGIVVSLKGEGRELTLSSAHATLHPDSHNLSVLSAMRSTSAAPTYFPTTKLVLKNLYSNGYYSNPDLYNNHTLKPVISHEYYMVTPTLPDNYHTENNFNNWYVFSAQDGAVSQNNPSLIGYTLCTYLYKTEKAHVFSFGTGTKSGDFKVRHLQTSKHIGMAQIFEKASLHFLNDPFLIEAKSFLAHQELEFKIGAQNLYRIQFKIKDGISMDSVKFTHLKSIIESSFEVVYASEFKKVINAIAELNNISVISNFDDSYKKTLISRLDKSIKEEAIEEEKNSGFFSSLFK